MAKLHGLGEDVMYVDVLVHVGDGFVMDLGQMSGVMLDVDVTPCAHLTKHGFKGSKNQTGIKTTPKINQN